ncbi:MAG TPA: queuosine salvage family protein [Syntrophales bacterium]|nr:queuosine salvage family protein [Syntrophales bacterium]HOX94762.1 queuosine salvage family protein [Syntrophales bacterium]HPI57473.1 queuosine salvage family protein [Syntrophales bacterium]HPN25670.1 queuosine salvage family protein [Syntrophales bacterium]HQM29498.1 queuosine salvage family protein [Syntrophales bacterium]
MNTPGLDEIRRACKAVAGSATFVRIHVDRIASYADSLMKSVSAPPALDPACHYLGRGEDTASFLLTLNAVNFGSGYFPHLRKRPGLSGYFTVASSLNDFYRKHGPPPAEALAKLRTGDCAGIFGQDVSSGPAAELMSLFAKALNDLGMYLIEHFDGRFVDLIEAAGDSAERLVGILSGMPFFNDVEQCGPLRVPFFKRAQITAADLSLAFDGDGWGRFEDLDRLTIFADNLVPHVLRVDGILTYDPDLASRIDREEPIPAHSREEIEIRACAVHAVELMVRAIRDRGGVAAAMNLDYHLWNRGQQPFYKNFGPRHRTRTVFY